MPIRFMLPALFAAVAALTITGCEAGEKPQPPKTEVRTTSGQTPRQPETAPRQPQPPAATTTGADIPPTSPPATSATATTAAETAITPPADATAVSDEARRALPEPVVAALEAARRDIAATAAPAASSVPVSERIQSARAILDNFSATALAAPGLGETQRAILTEFASTKKYIDWEEHGEAQTPEQYAEFIHTAQDALRRIEDELTERARTR